MVKWCAAACVASVVLAFGTQASATILEVDFTIDPTAADPWFQAQGAMSPYGLPADPILSGSFLVDSSIQTAPNHSDGSAITALSYTTGTRTWTLADIVIPGTFVAYNHGEVVGFGINLGFGNLVASGPAQVKDDNNWIVCNNCVAYNRSPDAGLPEPSVWGLMLLGFGAIGGALRSRPGAVSTSRRG